MAEGETQLPEIMQLKSVATMSDRLQFVRGFGWAS